MPAIKSDIRYVRRILPSGRRSVIRDIVFHGTKVPLATAGDSVTLVLADDIDVSRGDMLVSPADPPRAAIRAGAPGSAAGSTGGRPRFANPTKPAAMAQPMHAK